MANSTLYYFPRSLALVLLIAICRAASNTNATLGCCETRGIVISSLDVAAELIETARKNIPTCSNASLPTDCEDVLERGLNSSGVYQVLPKSRIAHGPISVYCDMVTDGGGWTVIQRRGNFLREIDYFFKDWESYKNGFGNLERDFWLGNDNIFALSNQALYSVRFDLQDVEGNRTFAVYDTFWIDDESHKYMLHVKGYIGNAGDSFETPHDGQKFSTKDQDNDNLDGNCAEMFKGAWWHDKCHASNLNGLYHHGNHESYADGVNWRSWTGYHESLEATEIKIRRKA